MIYISPEEISQITAVDTGFKMPTTFGRCYDYIHIYYKNKINKLKYDRIYHINESGDGEYVESSQYEDAMRYIKNALKLN